MWMPLRPRSRHRPRSPSECKCHGKAPGMSRFSPAYGAPCQGRNGPAPDPFRGRRTGALSGGRELVDSAGSGARTRGGSAGVSAPASRVEIGSTTLGATSRAVVASGSAAERSASTIAVPKLAARIPPPSARLRFRCRARRRRSAASASWTRRSRRSSSSGVMPGTPHAASRSSRTPWGAGPSRLTHRSTTSALTAPTTLKTPPGVVASEWMRRGLRSAWTWHRLIAWTRVER